MLFLTQYVLFKNDTSSIIKNSFYIANCLNTYTYICFMSMTKFKVVEKR